MTARAARISLADVSLAAAIRARLASAGWLYARDELAIRQEWFEPAPAGGRQHPREVRVLELPGQPGGRLAEGFNGHERVLIRCVASTDPALVLRTLSDWDVLPADGVVSR